MHSAETGSGGAPTAAPLLSLAAAQIHGLAARIAAQNQSAGQRQPIQAAVHASARAQQQAADGGGGGRPCRRGGARRATAAPQQENYAAYSPPQPQVDAAQLAAQEAELDRMLAEERPAAGMHTHRPRGASSPRHAWPGAAAAARGGVAAEDYATAAEIKQMLTRNSPPTRRAA